MNDRRAVRTLALFALGVGSLTAGALAQEAKPDEHGFLPVTADPPYAADTSGKYGGTLVWAELGEIDTFNVLVSNSATTSEVSSLVFDSLLQYDNSKWEFRPSLAASWEHSDDGLTWTFRLRKGVKWSDGEPFTSRDVAFSYRTTFNPKIENSTVDAFKIGDAPLPTFETPDDATFVLRCKALDAMLLSHAAGVPILPEHVWQKSTEGDSPTFPSVMGVADTARVIGTGPFRIKEYKAGERIVYEKNPYSWRATKDGSRLPFVDQVIVKLVKDMNTRTLQFLNGDLDVIDDIPAPDYKSFKDKEAEGWFTLHRLGLSLNTTYVCLNQHQGVDPATKEPFVLPYKQKWFQDRRFRRAISHAIDRDNIVKQILDGKGAAIYTDTTKGNKTWYSDTTTFPYDPAKANALLDEMGLTKRDKDGVRMDADGHRVSIDLMTNVENGVRIKVIGQIKNDWAAVGIEAVLLQPDFNTIVAAQESTHKWEAVVLGWGSSVPPDPLNGKNVLISSGRSHVWYPQQPAPANDFEKKSDELLAKMSSEIDEGKRKVIWAQILELHAQEQPCQYLYASNCYGASKKRVQNMRASVLRPSTWWNFEELWLDDGK